MDWCLVPNGREISAVRHCRLSFPYGCGHCRALSTLSAELERNFILSLHRKLEVRTSRLNFFQLKKGQAVADMETDLLKISEMLQSTIHLRVLVSCDTVTIG